MIGSSFHWWDVLHAWWSEHPKYAFQMVTNSTRFLERWFVTWNKSHFYSGAREASSRWGWWWGGRPGKFVCFKFLFIYLLNSGQCNYIFLPIFIINTSYVPTCIPTGSTPWSWLIPSYGFTASPGQPWCHAKAEFRRFHITSFFLSYTGKDNPCAKV